MEKVAEQISTGVPGASPNKGYNTRVGSQGPSDCLDPEAVEWWRCISHVEHMLAEAEDEEPSYYVTGHHVPATTLNVTVEVT